jgi:hypothetical protein
LGGSAACCAGRMVVDTSRAAKAIRANIRNSRRWVACDDSSLGVSYEDGDPPKRDAWDQQKLQLALEFFR